MARSPYASPYEKTLARCSDTEHPKGCWIGTDPSCRYGYQRANYWIPGLCKSVKLTTHILVWVAHETGARNMDEIYLAYQEFRASGLELDHECDEPACRNPGHLKAKTHSQNVMDGRERHRARRDATLGAPVVNYEHDESEIEF